jgi:hypothetical protein
MEVRYLIIARYAEFSPDAKLNILGGDSELFVADEYPHVIGLINIATKVVFDREDVEREHPFRAVIVEDGTNEIIAEGAKGTFPRIPFPEGDGRIGTGLLLPFFNVLVGKSGKYWVQVIIDEIVMAKSPFRVAPSSYYQMVSENLLESFQRKNTDGSHDSGPDQ